MATVSQPHFTFTHISISGVHFATVAYTTCPTASHGNANTRGGSTVPASLNTHSFPHTRNMQWLQERFWKRHLTQVGAALVSRRDPCPLLKPGIACAIDFYCQGCSTRVLSARTCGPGSRTWLRSSAQPLGASSWSACCTSRVDGGSFHGNDHTGNRREWKRPLPAPFLQPSSTWVERLWAPGPPLTSPSHRELTHGLPTTAGGLKPPLHRELQRSLNGDRPSAFPGQAASGVGGSRTTDGNWTRSLWQG